MTVRMRLKNRSINRESYTLSDSSSMVRRGTRRGLAKHGKKRRASSGDLEVVGTYLRKIWSSGINAIPIKKNVPFIAAKQKHRCLSPENQALLEIIDDLMATPDDKGEKWWDEFFKDLDKYKFKI